MKRFCGESLNMRLLCILIILCSQSWAQTPNSSLDELIKNIFTTDENPSTPEPPFKPVPVTTTVLGVQTPEPPTDTRKEPPKYKSCGFEKECVPRFLCKNDTISKYGEHIIDIRIDAECPYLEVCCDIPNKSTKPIIDIVPAEMHEGCGYQNPNGVGFKITGALDNEAEFGEFPWMVAILREESSSGDILNLYECGGALLAPTVVLTATHCVNNKIANSLIVRAGEWDTQTKNEVLPHQDRYVKEIIRHEKYNKGALFNDVALLILENPFVIEENVRPICLPPPTANFDHSRCFATGWGKDKFGKDGTYQVILKKLELPVVPNNVCQNNLRNTRLGKYFELHESFICAGGEKNKDTCKGDGGSPLVCPIPGAKNRFYQAGIVAWGIGCGELDVPGVYANVPHLMNWITEKLQARGIDFSYFTP